MAHSKNVVILGRFYFLVELIFLPMSFSLEGALSMSWGWTQILPIRCNFLNFGESSKIGNKRGCLRHFNRQININEKFCERSDRWFPNMKRSLRDLESHFIWDLKFYKMYSGWLIWVGKWEYRSRSISLLIYHTAGLVIFRLVHK